MSDNPFFILGLNFYPQADKEETCLRRLAECAEEWERDKSDPVKGPLYRAYIDMLPSFRTELSDEHKREEYAEKARNTVLPLADMLLKAAACKGYISHNDIICIGNLCSMHEEDVRRRSDDIDLSAFISDTDFTIMAQGSSAYSELNSLLRREGAKTIYEFLYKDSQIDRPEDMSCEWHRRTCEHLCDRPEYNTGDKAAIIEWCGIIFANNEKKEAYDATLRSGNVSDILSGLRGHNLTDSQVNDAVILLTENLGSKTEAWKTLLAFCRAEGIRLEYAGNRDETICICGAVNAKTESTCSSCGHPLTQKCPHCGEYMETSGLRPCSCSFSTAQAAAAQSALFSAQSHLFVMDFEEAEKSIPAVSVLSILHADDFLRSRISDMRRNIGDDVRLFREDLEGRKLVTAANRYASIRRREHLVRDENVEKIMGEGISRATALLSRAASAGNTDEKYRLLADAFDICADLRLSGAEIPAPVSVERISVSIDPYNRLNNISWERSRESGVRYVLVRSSSGPISSVSQGDIIYRGENTSYTDRDIAGGRAYYYNIFVERLEQYSECARGDTGATVNAFEPQNVKKEENNGSVTLSWEGLPDGANADVYKSLQGSEEHIMSVYGNSCTVRNLQNYTEYVFRVAFSYPGSWGIVKSGGVRVSAIPYRDPSPVTSGRIVTLPNGDKGITWDICDCDEVVWYISDTEPTAFIPGSMQKAVTSPVRIKSGEASVILTNKPSDGTHLVPVSVRRAKTALGRALRIGRDEVMSIKDVRPVNGKLYIYADIPKSADEIIAVYSDRGYPQGINAPYARTVRAGADYCRADGAIIVSDLSVGEWYISLYAKSGEVYSPPANYHYSNAAKIPLTYSFNVIKRPLGRSYVTLTVSCDREEFDLPDIKIVSTSGVMALFDTDGTVCAHIPAQRVRGSLTVNLPADIMRGKNTYLKPFLTDIFDVDRYTLSAAVGSTNKIN